MDRTCCTNCCNSQKLAAVLLRWMLALIFLVAGFSKLPSVGGFVNGYLLPAFEKTWLPGPLVAAYGYALPFVEALIGVWLLVGFWRVLALCLTGVTLLSLAFGMLLLKEGTTGANIALYVLMTAVALYMETETRPDATQDTGATAGPGTEA